MGTNSRLGAYSNKYGISCLNSKTVPTGISVEHFSCTRFSLTISFLFSKSHGVGQTRRNAFNPQRWYFEFANAKTGNTDSGKLLFIPLFF